ncbi:phosphate signaling complex protein PhoU [Corynebacterium variabile]|uniref:Phosphate transport system regulatory protein PhoU n=3 Tax=Corynebacterium variabile TaxID=1727 RepID=A0A0X2NNM3_9CORY|nr:phosphate signaling complex protein PhoU [Corynebacterium variabile]MDN6814702.1 phosphate signaling complex protein PhoU [Corynebacterium variabile]CUU67107.1 phosphate transport system regulatory protein PhoU [Corynebacterium variabile]
MRTVYQEQMRTFAHDLSLMSDRVRTMMSEACLALFDADIEKAETVLSSIDGVEELRKKAEQTSFELLALEGPVARDLRQVVSGTYIVEDLARMAALAVHVARTARRHHPDHTLPEQIEPYFREMARLTDEIGAKLHDVLVTYDPEKAMELALDDDAVDDLHEHMFQLTTKREWPFPVSVAVDVTLLSRFFERYSDHAVNIGTRVVYLATGKQPEEYETARRTEEQQETMREQFNEIRRRYGSDAF